MNEFLNNRHALSDEIFAEIRLSLLIPPQKIFGAFEWGAYDKIRMPPLSEEIDEAAFYVPQGVSISKMAEYAKSPRFGKATSIFIDPDIPEEVINRPAERGYWLIISFEEKEGYHLPDPLDMVIVNLLPFTCNLNAPLKRERYALCTDKMDTLHVVVGGFTDSLHISAFHPEASLVDTIFVKKVY